MLSKISKILLLLLIVSCEVENTTTYVPFVNTNEPTSIFTETAIFHGEVVGDGGLDIKEIGFVYSMNNPPTLADEAVVFDHTVNNGNGIGMFNTAITNLSPSTTYYYSAYAKNEKGVAYGNDIWQFTTTAEAPCTPINNSFNANTTLNMPNGSFSQTNHGDSGNLYGGDFYLNANTGYPNSAELKIFFDGDISSLQSGQYKIVNDLDFTNYNEDKVVVSVFYSGSYFFSQDYDNYVYVKRTGNQLEVTLCEVDIRGTIYYNSYDAEIQSRFTVTE